jgi:ribosomal subunit interface protein
VEIVVKCRRGVVTERFREHVAEKLAKLDRLEPRVISIEVEVIHETNPRLSAQGHRVELTCRKRGPVVRGEASAEDVHAALDLAFAKLEERLRRAADRRRVHHGSRAPLSVATALAPDLQRPQVADSELVGTETPTEGESKDGAAAARTEGPTGSVFVTDRQVDDDGPHVVREKRHASLPMTLDQALHEMELVGHDFFLYWDSDVDLPSVAYHRRGYRYGVLRLDR